MCLRNKFLICILNHQSKMTENKSVKKETPEEAERKKTRLRMCIMTNLVLFGVIGFSIFTFSDGQENKYLRFGPHEDLNIIGVKINTWKNYILLQVFLAFIQITDVVINEIANPILGFNIYNPDKDEITEFTRTELQMYANVHWMVNALRNTLMVLVTISQLDIAVLRVIYGEITSFFTIRMLLKEKKFPNEDREVYAPVSSNGVEMV